MNEIIGVVGAGIMGRGIIQLFAQSGRTVLCFDAVEGAAAKAVAFVSGMIHRSVEKKKLSAEQGEAIIARMSAVASLAALSRCDVVIEAVVEDLDVKRQLFALLEGIVGEHAILASNTSSLLVSDIASGAKHPTRIAGLHFFNPVPLMKVTEIVAAVHTSAATVETLRTMIAATGHRAVVTADQPGFLVNHAGRAYPTEALRILEERVADHEDIDALLREAAGFRMGPFELLDLTGLDVSGKVMESIYQQFQQEPRYRPSSLVPPRVSAGLYGRKTGRGWYAYENEKKVEKAERPIPTLPTGVAVWIDPHAARHASLIALCTKAGVDIVDRDAASLLIVQPWGTDATSHCAEHGLDAARVVAVDPITEPGKRATLMLTVATSAEARDAALALLSVGGPVTVINDSPGFVVQRVLAHVVNVACGIAQRGIASVDDLESAVQLGLGYPHGPLAWGDHLGGARVLEILRNLEQTTGDPRYRPTLWLKRRVALGLSLTTPATSR
ncbi:MAG: 3-hydroxyacyl-CoA dehydrogenase [Polyangia bacterium]